MATYLEQRASGKPFSFDGHEFLRDLYQDTGPHVVLMKAAQIGGTVCKSRVGPLIEDNPFLNGAAVAINIAAFGSQDRFEAEAERLEDHQACGKDRLGRLFMVAALGRLV